MAFGVGRVAGMRTVVLVLGLMFGGWTAVLVRRAPEYSVSGGSWVGGPAELLVGWALVGAGLATVKRHTSFGPALTAAGLAWFLLEWNNPGAGSAIVFTIGLVAYAGCVPLVAYAVLSYRAVRLSAADRLAMATLFVSAFLGLGLVPALLTDPAGTGCATCPANLLLVHADASAAVTVNRLGLWLTVVGVLATAVLAILQLTRSTVARRRTVAAVVIPGIAYLGLVACWCVHSARRGYLSNDPVDRGLWFGQGAALVAMVLGVAAEGVRASRARSAVARLVVEVAGSPPPGGLRDALADLLGDSSLEVLYELTDGRLVDGRGRSSVTAAGQAETRLVRRGETVALVTHRPGLLDDPQLAGEITGAARLALEHERLQAEAAAQIEDLRSSSARIVEAGDAERRRLERDLHDGAQQRLISLALSLRLMALRSDGRPGSQERLHEAEAEVKAALADLREIAHGLYPNALADEGLAAALETLAEGHPIRITLGSLPDSRFAPPVESAAYFVVAETLNRSYQSRLATVTAAQTNDQLVVDIETDAQPPEDLTDVEDRVGTLSGRLMVERLHTGGTRIHAEVPCAS
ncbi:histidine kinase [Kribbella sp. NPDC006257]|uniref:sensor histidine kinase n=1 Tax=Kribbella sp. NPDC006257 TaxID=3156738 RepID=UPI00339EE77F